MRAPARRVPKRCACCYGNGSWRCRKRHILRRGQGRAAPGGTRPTRGGSVLSPGPACSTRGAHWGAPWGERPQKRAGSRRSEAGVQARSSLRSLPPSPSSTRGVGAHCSHSTWVPSHRESPSLGKSSCPRPALEEQSAQRCESTRGARAVAPTAASQPSLGSSQQESCSVSPCQATLPLPCPGEGDEGCPRSRQRGRGSAAAGLAGWERCQAAWCQGWPRRGPRWDGVAGSWRCLRECSAHPHS